MAARYDRAGGALLAGGLAYSALFAIVPLALVAAGLIGLGVSDSNVREQAIATIADVLPPIRGLLGQVLTELARNAGTISIVGAATLIWGGSRFILAFENAMVRIAGESHTRNLVERNLLGFATAAVLVGAVVFGAVVAGLAEFLDAAAAVTGLPVVSSVAQLALSLLPLALTVGAVVIVYRFVFEARPSWTALWRPSWVVALALAIVARLFVYIAPRLIGAAATIGSLATAFAALAWLGLSFQALLVGAAWVTERFERERASSSGTGEPDGTEGGLKPGA